MFEKFGVWAHKVIEASRAECARLKGTSVGTEHLLLALASDNSLATKALASTGINYAHVQREIERLIASGQKPVKSAEQATPTFSESAMEAVSFAHDQARYFGQSQIQPEHLLLGITDLKEAAAN